MKGIIRTLPGFTATVVGMLMVLGATLQVQGQEQNALYPAMAPIDQYQMARESEIVLARSAAPESISGDAEILVLGRKGFETAVKGKNGFVCMVVRSWAAGTDDPEFWNPKVRSPICFNAAAVRSYLPHVTKKTEWVMAGRTKAQIADEIKAAFEKKEFPPLESGAMCYMMSKQGHLSDRDGHWHPHLMFFVSPTDPTAWGASLPESPILGVEDSKERVTIFLIPVGKWSDGTAAPSM